MPVDSDFHISFRNALPEKEQETNYRDNQIQFMSDVDRSETSI